MCPAFDGKTRSVQYFDVAYLSAFLDGQVIVVQCDTVDGLAAADNDVLIHFEVALWGCSVVFKYYSNNVTCILLKNKEMFSLF